MHILITCISYKPSLYFSRLSFLSLFWVSLLNYKINNKHNLKNICDIFCSRKFLLWLSQMEE